MASSYEIEVKISSAKNLKNVNWRNGSNRPYVVVWVDPTQKHSTGVAQSGDSNIEWDDKLMIHVPPVTTIDDTTLYIDVVHASTEPNDNRLIIGSAKLQLITVGVGERVSRTLNLMRPSGRPQGTIDVKVAVKQTSYCTPHGVYATPAYGAPPTTVNSATPAVGYGVPTPLQYNAQLNNGPGHVGRGSDGYVRASFRSGNRQSGPTRYGSRTTIFGSRPASFGSDGVTSFGSGGATSFGSGGATNFGSGHVIFESGSRLVSLGSGIVSYRSGIVNYGPSQVVNVIMTDGSEEDQP